MIDIVKLRPILAGYKAYFPSHWEDEKYKWEAIKHFQDHWNIDAENFGEMFKTATDKTFNLLASGYAYPRGMIINFAKADDSTVRQMFRDLFDESRDLAARGMLSRLHLRQFVLSTMMERGVITIRIRMPSVHIFG